MTYEPVDPRRTFASSSRLPRGDSPTVAITSRGLENSTGLDLYDELCAACRCNDVSIVYGSFSFLLPPEVVPAAPLEPEVAGCFLTLKRRDGCRSSLGDEGPEGPRSERLDLLDFDDPCLLHTKLKLSFHPTQCTQQTQRNNRHRCNLCASAVASLACVLFLCRLRPLRQKNYASVCVACAACVALDGNEA